jgi:hypothetical protein
VLSSEGIFFLYLSPARHYYGHWALCNKVKFMQVVPKQSQLDQPRTGSQIAHDQGIRLPCMQTFPFSLLILSNLDDQNRLLFYFSLSAHFLLFQVCFFSFAIFYLSTCLSIVLHSCPRLQFCFPRFSQACPCCVERRVLTHA